MGSLDPSITALCGSIGAAMVGLSSVAHQPIATQPQACALVAALAVTVGLTAKAHRVEVRANGGTRAIESSQTWPVADHGHRVDHCQKADH
jgi:hypothetical protein